MRKLNKVVRSRILVIVFSLLFAVLMFFSAGGVVANAASVNSTSTKYKLPIALSGVNSITIYGSSSASASGTVSSGTYFTFKPKYVEFIVKRSVKTRGGTSYSITRVELSGPTDYLDTTVNESGTKELTTTFTYTLPTLADGQYSLTMNSTSKYYGGTAKSYTGTFSFIVDTTKPTLSGASTSTVGKYVNKAFTVTASDATAGVESIYVMTPGTSSYYAVSGATISYPIGSTNGLYRFYAKDKAGLQSSTYYVYLDTVNPVGKFVGENNSVIQSGSTISQTFSYSATDSGSGISTIQYKTPSSSVWKTYTSGTKITSSSEKGVYTFRATDKAGNVTTNTITLEEEDPCAAGHSYKSDTVSPTCTSGGYTRYTCTVCGYSYVANQTAALGHDYQTTITDGTCTSPAKITYTCSRCGDSYTEETSSALGHAYSTETINPTCTSGGYTLYTCTRCGYSYKEDTSAALGHSYVATTSPSTCTEGGYTTYKCTRCGVSYTDSPTQAAGHSYVASITESTCTERGYTTYTCTKCGDSYRDNETAPLGHNYVMETVSATCTEKGGTVYTCTRCGKSYKGSETEALGHAYVSETIAPTCEKGGYTLHTCSRCGSSYTDSVTQPLGHNFVTTTKEATCTEYGRIVYTCQICGYERAEENGIYPTGHNYSNYIIKAATCTQDGERRYVCDKCGDEYTEKIVATGHSYAITDSHSENGKTVRTYTCTVCGDSYIQELDDQYEEVSTYVEELFDAYSPYMIWVFLGTAAIWSIVMGVFFAIAQKNEEKEKAKKMIVNYVIGLVVIFAILVACPFLVRGIAVLVT